MTVLSNISGIEYSVAVPRHQTLNSILAYVADYLGMTTAEMRQQLFGR